MNVEEMPAGEAMDALVAERIMGFADAKEFHPSCEIADALAVAEKLGGVVAEDWRHYELPYKWSVFFCLSDGGTSADGTADTLPLAICRAALLVPPRLAIGGRPY